MPVKQYVYVLFICLLLFLFYAMYFQSITFAEDIKVTNIKVGSGRPYKVGEGGLKIGTVYYIDRAYVVNTIPKELDGALWIMTANDDKNSVGEDFLRFTVNVPVIVWLAHDSRGEEEKGGKPPEWLSADKGWEKHPDMKIDVTDSNMGFFILWSKSFNKGEIKLGGNADPPAAGQGSNYIVILTPGKNLSVEPNSKLYKTWAYIKHLH